jgi:hypothetical protein
LPICERDQDESSTDPLRTFEDLRIDKYFKTTTTTDGRIAASARTKATQEGRAVRKQTGVKYHLLFHQVKRNNMSLSPQNVT